MDITTCRYLKKGEADVRVAAHIEFVSLNYKGRCRQSKMLLHDKTYHQGILFNYHKHNDVMFSSMCYRCINEYS